MNLAEHEEFLCPYCGEPNTLLVDFTAGRSQKFIVDCEVCCAPIAVHLRVNGNEILAIDVRKENE